VARGSRRELQFIQPVTSSCAVPPSHKYLFVPFSNLTGMGLMQVLLTSSHTAGACDAWVPGADPCRGLFQTPFLHESAAISRPLGVLEVGGTRVGEHHSRAGITLQESTSPPLCYFKHVFVPAPRRRTIG
jgi:hypothetical protein